MAFRTFSDAEGNEWQAFDVVPRANERRRYDRRSGALLIEEDGDRRDGDRRVTVGGRSSLTPGIHDGWLCFEHGDDRRRLSPIPPDWSHATDEQLAGFLRAASRVRPSTRSAPAAQPEP